MSSMLTPVRPEECVNVHASEDNVKAFVNDQEIATGKLIISESIMCWQKVDGYGLTLPYPAISLHAVSRDLNAFPHECLYLMIDPVKLPGDGAPPRNQEDAEGDQEEILEMRFVPQSGETLGRLFDALSECQLLHPDPEDDDLSDDYVDAEEDGEEEPERVGGGGDGTPAMQQLAISESTRNGHLIDETNRSETAQDSEAGQFDDAEDMEAD